MRQIEKDYVINASPASVWNALTDPDVIDAWGGGPVEMAPETNFEFSLWGGDIHGRNLEVVPEKKLAQEWFSGDWQEPSIVTFSISKTRSGTRLLLTQDNVPEEEINEIDSGWDDFYLGPLKDYLEGT